MIITTRRSLLLAPVVALSCALLLLAGCGSANSAPAAPAGQDAGNGGQPGSGQRAGTGGGNDPGRVSGEIASVDGSTLQIQDGERQTAVTYTTATTFTAQVAGKVGDIQTGECVVVFSPSTDEAATALTATSLTATPGSGSGGCGFGFGGGGNRPSGAPSGQPSTGGQAGGPAPSDVPSGAVPGGNPSAMPNGGGRPRSGTVTAVEGSTLTVAVTRQDSDATTSVTVTTTADTTVTVTKKSKASAAKVGVCATANGKADDTGAVKAATITLRTAGSTGCSMRGNR